MALQKHARDDKAIKEAAKMYRIHELYLRQHLVDMATSSDEE
jgi:hypothetical protein